MKLDPAVKKETLFAALGMCILVTLMLAVFLVIGKFNFAVLLGGLIGGAVAFINFFAMCLTLQKAVSMPEENHMKLVRASQSIRLMLIALVVILCLSVAKLNVFATMIPLIFPRILMLIRGIMIAKDNKNEP